ncbi:MAG: cytochrome P450 [Acidimicrobiia bacterium]
MTSCPVAHGYDPLAPDTVRNPHPVLSKLRAEGPVFYLPELDHYLVTRYEDVETVLYDRDTYSAANASSPLNPVCPAAQKVLDDGGYRRVPTFNNADPPRHPIMRKAVLSCMTPRRLRSLEPPLRDYATALIKSVKDETVLDFISQVAFPFPGYAAFTLLGFPPADTDQLKAWSETRVLLTYGRLSEAEQVRVAGDIVSMWQYCERHVANKAADLGDDLTSDLIRYSNDKPDLVTHFDIVNMLYSMALAGHETTTNTIGSGVFALLQNREQWDALVADRSKIANAVEEILRYEGPVINHRRITTCETVLGGVELPKGARVMMCFASADRDPAIFDNGDDFDVSRENAELHLAFGKGAHLCLGAALGRLEVQIVLELLTEHMPGLELIPGQDIVYSPNALFRSLTKLMVAPRGLAAAGIAG